MARRSSDVEIFHFVESGPGKGMRVGTAAARHTETKRAVRFHAAQVGAEASSILASHRYAGDAEITVEDGDEAKGANPEYVEIEQIVVLNDERGFGAAMTIEFGMAPAIDTEGYFYPGTEAIAPLRRAASLEWQRRPAPHGKTRLPNPYSRRWRH